GRVEVRLGRTADLHEELAGEDRHGRRPTREAGSSRVLSGLFHGRLPPFSLSGVAGLADDVGLPAPRRPFSALAGAVRSPAVPARWAEARAAPASTRRATDLGRARLHGGLSKGWPSQSRQSGPWELPRRLDLERPTIDRRS